MRNAFEDILEGLAITLRLLFQAAGWLARIMVSPLSLRLLIIIAILILSLT